MDSGLGDWRVHCCGDNRAVPILTYGHELWVVTKRMKSSIREVWKSFLWRESRSCLEMGWGAGKEKFWKCLTGMSPEDRTRQTEEILASLGMPWCPSRCTLLRLLPMLHRPRLEANDGWMDESLKYWHGCRALRDPFFCLENFYVDIAHVLEFLWFVSRLWLSCVLAAPVRMNGMNVYCFIDVIAGNRVLLKY